MDLTSFRDSLAQEAPPAADGSALPAPWFGTQAQWDRAHELSQQTPDPDGGWVHASLHRVESDEGKAGYWYRRTGQTPQQGGVRRGVARDRRGAPGNVAGPWRSHALCPLHLRRLCDPNRPTKTLSPLQRRRPARMAGAYSMSASTLFSPPSVTAPTPTRIPRNLTHIWAMKRIC